MALQVSGSPVGSIAAMSVGVLPDAAEVVAAFGDHVVTNTITMLV